MKLPSVTSRMSLSSNLSNTNFRTSKHGAIVAVDATSGSVQHSAVNNRRQSQAFVSNNRLHIPGGLGSGGGSFNPSHPSSVMHTPVINKPSRYGKYVSNKPGIKTRKSIVLRRETRLNVNNIQAVNPMSGLSHAKIAQNLTDEQLANSITTEKQEALASRIDRFNRYSRRLQTRLQSIKVQQNNPNDRLKNHTIKSLRRLKSREALNQVRRKESRASRKSSISTLKNTRRESTSEYTTSAFLEVDASSRSKYNSDSGESRSTRRCSNKISNNASHHANKRVEVRSQQKINIPKITEPENLSSLNSLLTGKDDSSDPENCQLDSTKNSSQYKKLDTLTVNSDHQLKKSRNRLDVIPGDKNSEIDIHLENGLIYQPKTKIQSSRSIIQKQRLARFLQFRSPLDKKSRGESALDELVDIFR